ncbi:MAG: lysophospholipid acyltransferase family protein [Kiritimatiellae bacterium]|nr:lysophospholipid acyltransferase family protein [Kiritimatiellia bacterium]
MAYFLLRLLVRCLAALPLRAAIALGRHWGRLCANVLRIRRREVLDTLVRCFPEKSPAERLAIYRGVWQNQCLTIVEVARYMGGRVDEVAGRMEVIGQAGVQSLLDDTSRGCLVLISHLGNYPLLAFNVPRLFHRRLSFIFKEFRSPAVNRAWNELHEKAGVTGIPAKNAYRPALRALRNGDILGFMLDQNRPASEGLFVPFFSRTASTSPGLALMSYQSGCPVIPVFARRAPDGHHIVEIGTPVPPPAGRDKNTLLAATARYTALLEDAIRAHPDQWLWLHRRWKSRPPAESPPSP